MMKVKVYTTKGYEIEVSDKFAKLNTEKGWTVETGLLQNELEKEIIKQLGIKPSATFESAELEAYASDEEVFIAVENSETKETLLEY